MASETMMYWLNIKKVCLNVSQDLLYIDNITGDLVLRRFRLVINLGQEFLY